MIEVYQQQLIKYYKKYLRDIISGNPFNAITLRGGKAKPNTTAELHRVISLFQQNEKATHGKGWTIEWVDWSSKKVGEQKWISSVIVATEEDYLYLLKKEEEVTAFKAQVQVLLSWQPLVQAYLIEKPGRVLDLRNDWSDIRGVIDYLLQHDVSGYYIRNIPVPVHTKFMEQHRALILSLLRLIRSDKYNQDKQSLDQALLLKLKPHLYPVRWLDRDLAKNQMHGMEVTGVPIDWLQQVNWDIKEVWLVENETNLYLIPERKNAIAIFSKGYATHKLKEIPFLQHVVLYYWGDLDEDGYKMLNSMREFYPDIKSIFMDEATLLQHRTELGKQEAKYKTATLPLLTDKERAAFNILKHHDHNGRLEQERIRQDYIAAYLQEMESLL